MAIEMAIGVAPRAERDLRKVLLGRAEFMHVPPHPQREQRRWRKGARGSEPRL